MKATLAIILCLTLSGTAHAQAANDPEQIVRQVINTGMIQGWDQKVLVRLGDAGAVLATKILAGGNLTPKTISGALLVVENSFAAPKFVEVSADREPRTSLLLIRYLELSTSDSESRKNVADTRKYVEDRYATFLKSNQQ